MSAESASASFDLAKGPKSTVSLHDGSRMPVLGLGVWQTPKGAQTRTAVSAALSFGYRLVDTAALYANEEEVGEAIRASDVPRDEVFVTTKLWNDDQGYDRALRAFDRSRTALGVGPVDLYLIHWPVERLRVESWRALVKLRREGACRSIGVSNFTVRHLEELIQQSDVIPTVNQVEFNPFLYQRDLLQFCQRHRIQLEAYAPLARAKRLDDAGVRAIGNAHGKTPAQVVLRWGLQRAVVVIPKSVHPDRIRENAELFDFELTSAEMSRLDGLDESFRTTWDPSRMP